MVAESAISDAEGTVVLVDLYDATTRQPLPELVLVDDDEDDELNAEDTQQREPVIAGRRDQPPVAPVRRGQYRQLFAKLRRG